MPPTPPAPAPLGAVLTGGGSRRFGSPKALAAVGGRPIAARAAAALRRAGAAVVLVAGEAAPWASLGLPVVPDRIPGAGPVAGVEAALRRAVEEGRPGALCVACDLPFLSPALLRRLVAMGLESGARAVVPESPGRRGYEPLCAWYAASALPEAEVLLDAGGGPLVALLDVLHAVRLPLADVLESGDPAVLFLNVNTPEDHLRAEEVAARSTEGVG